MMMSTFFQVLVESKKNPSDDMTESDSKLKVLYLTIHDSVIMRYSHVQFKILYCTLYYFTLYCISEFVIL